MDEGAIAELLREMRAQREETAQLRAEIAAARDDRARLAEQNAALAATLAQQGLVMAKLATMGAAAATPTNTTDLTFQQLWERRKKHVGTNVAYAMVPVLKHFGPRPVSALVKADFYHYLTEVRPAEKTSLGGSPAVGTLNQERAHTMAMLNWAVRAGVLAVNPFAGVAKLKGQHVRETQIDPFELDDALDGERLLVVVYLIVCVETGMRNAAEVRRMEWSHIDEAKALIRLPRTNSKTKETREVPLSACAKEWLEAMPRVLGSPFVFANPQTKRPYSKGHMHYLCRPVLNKLKAAPGDGNVHIHDARHGLVSRLQRLGMGLFAAMKIIGHRSPTMHWRYTHITDADRTKARELLDADRKAPRPASPTEEPGAPRKFGTSV